MISRNSGGRRAGARFGVLPRYRAASGAAARSPHIGAPWPRRPARPPRSRCAGSVTPLPAAALLHQHAADDRDAEIARSRDAVLSAASESPDQDPGQDDQQSPGTVGHAWVTPDRRVTCRPRAFVRRTNEPLSSTDEVTRPCLPSWPCGFGSRHRLEGLCTSVKVCRTLHTAGGRRRRLRDHQLLAPPHRGVRGRAGALVQLACLMHAIGIRRGRGHR